MNAIDVEHIAKRYVIGGVKELGYKTIRDSISGMFRRRATTPSVRETIWALRDVSFSAAEGEVIGIIGRNGAGKSTLLKVLSRITEPTEGRARMRGLVGSLLEVGTGFHPELTGRENIFLNGAILGMPRAEIVRKLDEIVAFAEVEQFLDTPVKRYSSGMYVRLAFAVAAHLDTDVLIVDEVLAVGDASFQRKCLNKMEDVGKQGRTVLFVSHNLSSVTRLCPRAILIDAGRVVRDGPSHEVVRSYLHSDLGTTAAREWRNASEASGNDWVKLRAIRVRDDAGAVSDKIDIRKPADIELEWDVLRDGRVLVPNLHFFNQEGLMLFVSSDLDVEWRGRPRPPGRYVSTVRVPGNFLAEGTVVVGAAVSTMDPVEVHFYERDAVAFEVVDALAGDSVRGDYGGDMPGVVRPLLPWRNRYEPEAAP
ncbi:MAG TPA: ABC transporter ATP-binding protein [Thermoanaerobaculia bacterium]|nr:ABC transporter ATP-binding protein [Thermoanaerobaculia bacterium]